MRKKIIAGGIFSVLVLFVLLGANFLFSESVWAQGGDRRLQEWGNQNREEFGPLLTPPWGIVAPDVQAARQEVRRILEKLYGTRLTQADFHLVIDIHESTKIKSQVMLAGTNFQQYRSRRNLSIRNVLGFNQDRKPIFILSVTTGLLKNTGSEDELAFELGRELIHIFENHIEGTANFDSNDSNQRKEAVADVEAVLAMRGKYDCAASIKNLERRYKDPNYLPAEQEKDLLGSGIQNFHHQGLRISILQGIIENWRRTDISVRSKPPTALSSRLRVRSWQRPQIPFSRMFEREQTTLRTVVESYFLKNKSYDLLATNNRPQNHIRFIESIQLGSDQQLRDAFWHWFQNIKNASVNKQIKIDSVLKLMMLFDQPSQYTSGERSIWQMLSESDMDQVRMFFLSHATGAGAWSADLFLKNLQGAGIEAYQLMQYFTGGQRLQNEMHLLTSRNRNFRELYEKLPLAVVRDANGKIQIDKCWLLTMRGNDLKNDKNPMAALFKNSVVRFFQDTDFNVQAAAEFPADKWLTQGRFHYRNVTHSLYQKNRDEEDLVFMNQIRAAVQPATDRYRQVATASHIRTLQDATTSPEILMLTFAEIFNLNDRFPLSQIERQSVKKALQKNAEKLVALAHQRPQGLESDMTLNHSYLLLLAEILNESPSKEIFFHLLDLTIHPSGGLIARKDNVHFAAAHNAIRKYMAQNLSKEEILAIFDINTSAAYEAAMHTAYSQPQGHHHPYLVDYWTHRKTSYLALLGDNTDLRTDVVNKLNWRDLMYVLQSLKKSEEKRDQDKQYISGNRLQNEEPTSISVSASGLLMDTLLRTQEQCASLAEWEKVYQDISSRSTFPLEFKSSYRKEIQDYLERKWFPTLTVESRMELLEKKNIRTIFPAERVADYLVDYSQSSRARAQALMYGGVQGVISDLEKRFEMNTDNVVLGKLFREKYLKFTQAQPGQLRSLFPDTSHSNTQRSRGASGYLEGMSVMISLTRKQSVQDQIAMIDYLMGRNDNIPAFYRKIADDTSRAGMATPLITMLQSAREKLLHESSVERAMAVNGFLAGTNSIVERSNDLNILLDHIFKGVGPDRRAMARLIADSLLEANKDQKSLALGYVLGQPVAQGQNTLSDGNLLVCLLMAHGVPGIKLGQYLAFTNQFKEFGQYMEDFQDQASPLEYADVIETLNERFGGNWPEKYKVVKMLGFGSVNIAVELFNKETNEEEVVSILRPDIETATEESFRKFNLFLEELAKRSTQEADFTFLRGLSKIVEKSVGLEFDKDAAFAMQTQVWDRYKNIRINNWNVTSVQALRVQNGGVFMKKAKGKTAKSLFKKDPVAYREAMRVMSQVEMDILLGIGADGQPLPVALHANPDFHDGQVIIDVENRLIQILDFGQAVSISNEQRLQALDFLRIISRTESVSSALNIVNTASRASIGRDIFNSEEMKKILNHSTERMDLFIKLISEMSLKGFDLGMPQVHWILAVNRQLVLGQKIGVNNEAIFRNLIISRKLGMSQDLFNRVHLGARNIRDFVVGIVGSATEKTKACIAFFKKK